jgi:hypothetical protein
MTPTYLPGDWLMARWGHYGLRDISSWQSWLSWSSRVKVGDVVVIERPEQPGVRYVKRISEMRIESDQIFLLSDNPEGSDSRQWGWLPTISITAKITGRVRRAKSN